MQKIFLMSLLCTMSFLCTITATKIPKIYEIRLNPPGNSWVQIRSLVNLRKDFKYRYSHDKIIGGGIGNGYWTPIRTEAVYYCEAPDPNSNNIEQVQDRSDNRAECENYWVCMGTDYDEFTFNDEYRYGNLPFSSYGCEYLKQIGAENECQTWVPDVRYESAMSYFETNMATIQPTTNEHMSKCITHHCLDSDGNVIDRPESSCEYPNLESKNQLKKINFMTWRVKCHLTQKLKYSEH